MNDTYLGTTSFSGSLEDGKPQSLLQQLEVLAMAIGSGDLESVQTIFDTIVSRLPRGAEIGGDDPVGEFLLAVEDGIAARDMETLLAAADEFAVAEVPDDEAHDGLAAAIADGAVRDGLAHLLNALQQDDSEEAETAFEGLMMAINDSELDDDGDSSLREALELVSDALLTGDTEQALELLQSAIQALASGGLPNTAS